jgi:hypothetical protein
MLLTENQGESKEIEFDGYATGKVVAGSSASGTSGYMTASPSTEPPVEPPVSKRKLRLAILAHIRAIRTLGRTERNTQEIADALGISVQEVNEAVEGLRREGVRRR